MNKPTPTPFESGDGCECKKWDERCHYHKKFPQTMASVHTPTPWKWVDRELQGSNGDVVLDDGSAGDEYSPVIDPKGANAAFIVRVVNAHEELLELLQLALVTVEDEELIADIQQAIAKAEAV